jgi:sulfite reductase (NADPH) hemoprotein beta-component
VTASFVPPTLADKTHLSAEDVLTQLTQAADADKNFARWLQQNVAPHRNPHLRVVTLSFKRLGQAPGDATADQLDASALLADKFSAGEARVSHDQNLVLPWVAADQLTALYKEAPGVDRHDCLPRRRLLRLGQRPFIALGCCYFRALPRPRRIIRLGRN